MSFPNWFCFKILSIYCVMIYLAVDHCHFKVSLPLALLSVGSPQMTEQDFLILEYLVLLFVLVSRIVLLKWLAVIIIVVPLHFLITVCVFSADFSVCPQCAVTLSFAGRQCCVIHTLMGATIRLKRACIPKTDNRLLMYNIYTHR